MSEKLELILADSHIYRGINADEARRCPDARAAGERLIELLKLVYDCSHDLPAHAQSQDVDRVTQDHILLNVGVRRARRCAGILAAADGALAQGVLSLLLGLPYAIPADQQQIWFNRREATLLKLEGFLSRQPQDSPSDGKRIEAIPKTKKTHWRDVQRRLLTLYEEGEPFTTVDELAERMECSPSTITKAIHPPQSALKGLDEAARKEAIRISQKLAGWQARHMADRPAPKSARAQSLTKVHLDNIAQTDPPDPSDVAQVSDDDDAIFNRLIQEAETPEKRAQLHAMSDARRRELIELIRNDPDKYDRILGRAP